MKIQRFNDFINALRLLHLPLFPIHPVTISPFTRYIFTDARLHSGIQTKVDFIPTFLCYSTRLLYLYRRWAALGNTNESGFYLHFPLLFHSFAVSLPT